MRTEQVYRNRERSRKNLLLLLRVLCLEWSSDSFPCLRKLTLHVCALSTFQATWSLRFVLFESQLMSCSFFASSSFVLAKCLFSHSFSTSPVFVHVVMWWCCLGSWHVLGLHLPAAGDHPPGTPCVVLMHALSIYSCMLGTFPSCHASWGHFSRTVRPAKTKEKHQEKTLHCKKKRRKKTLNIWALQEEKIEVKYCACTS